ncbi:MAG: fimbrillin family protein [Rikenellaceae bacterium]
MKKSYTLATAIALFAVAVVGCSTDDLESQSGSSGGGGTTTRGTITLLPTTTRATENTLTILQKDGEGIPIFATTDDDSDNYYINGDKSAYSESTLYWNWSGTTYDWPEAATKYPMLFYSYYPVDESVWTVTSVEGSGVRSLTSDITIQSSDEQQDLLAAMNTTLVSPVGGLLTLTFKHILSRVVFNITTVDDVKVYLQQSTMNDLLDNNTYDLMSQSWATLETSVGTADYNYLTFSNPALTLVADASSLSTGETAYASTYNNLMLLPHTFTIWDGSTTIEGARVEIVYRSTLTSGDDQVGYTRADSHPDYATADVATRPSASSPLFVKVALPLITTANDDNLLDNTWYSGLQYTYNLTLGGYDSNNGYLIDEYFYDEEGNQTILEVTGVDVGDALTSGEICFDVLVDAWGSSSSYLL